MPAFPLVLPKIFAQASSRTKRKRWHWGNLELFSKLRARTCKKGYYWHVPGRLITSCFENGEKSRNAETELKELCGPSTSIIYLFQTQIIV
jgi:hypothetical protein